MNTGLDPELLTMSGTRVVPASTYLPKPYKDKDGLLNQLSYDNAAAEFRPRHNGNVILVMENLRTLLWNSIMALGTARRLAKIPPDTVLSLCPAGAMRQEDRVMASVATFGCSPSMTLDDDYVARTTVPLATASSTAVRSAGFHVHQELPFVTTQMVVAVLDGLLGLVDVLANARLGYTAESRARRLTLGYGRAGEYRTRSTPGNPPILEYRTLSPWPFMAPGIAVWVMRRVRTVSLQPEQVLLGILNDYPKRSDITNAINMADVTGAKDLLTECRLAWAKHTGTGYDAKREVSMGGYSVKDLASTRRPDDFIDRWR